MGNQLAGIAPSQIFPVEHYLTDLPDFSYDTNLGSTRFFKVARAKNKEGLTVVKVFVIHDPSLPLKAHRDRVEEIRRLLATGSNCLPFQGTILTEKSGILVRQFVKDNLYDRISTRPFLNSIEKRWIAFQLLNCLYHCHKLAVCHGDIKLENIMVTSWNWVFLTDFASFKPTYLPEDNPADFSYFFDTSRRRTCYIAPERFVKTLNSEAVHNSTVTSLVLPDDEIKKGDLTPAMDIFSMGCALTELFTEGHAPFDFSQLLAYRSGEYSPWKVLEKIDDLCIRELVRSMMQKDPSKRLDAGEYLKQMRNKAFPEYFYTFLEGYVKGFASVPILTPDEKVERLRNDIDIIIEAVTEKEKTDDASSCACLENGFSEGLVIMVPLLTSCLRSLKHCTAKLHALEVLKKMAMYLSPDIILDRLLPYMVFLAKDKYPRVCVAVIQTLTACLTMVKSIPRSDSNIFPEYILPNLAHIAQDEAVIVRMAYAGNIDVLAETALRFLEMTQLDTEPDADRCSSTDVQRHHHQQVSYDMELQALQELIQQSVTTLLSDPVNAVKQTLLEEGINRLCVFFGRQKGNDVLLSHMITFLNDKEDRHLRGAFFDGIVGVAAYVGWQCCPILKPLLQQGLADAEEFVIAKALHAMSDLTELGLIQKQMLYDLVAEAIPLLCHPNLWIKQGAVGFVCAVARCLNLADVQCKLIPLLQPFLKQPIIQVELEFALLSNVQDPLPRCLFDYLIRLPTLPTLLECLRERKVLRSIARAGHQPAYREMDNHMKIVFRRLQSDGMTETVEDKILAMKDHLLKMHKNKACVPDPHSSSKEEGVIDLSTFPSHVPLHSVLLTGIDRSYEGQLKVGQRKLGKKKGSSVESPNVTMVYRSTHAYGFVTHHKKNEEWLHMFGSAETKSPSSPKLQHHSSDPLPPYSKTPQIGKDVIIAEGSVPDPSGTSLSSDGKNSPSIHSVSEVRLKTNICVPCQEELQSLIRKKQEEWTCDEIVREASEIGIKEDKLLPHKWHPRGNLVAHLHEHRRAVNRIQVIPDTSLFATCSSDGTVKIWDCGRMEGRNVANRSRQTYSRLEGPVSSLTMCQNMQSLAAASDNGNIHVFRIAQDSPKSSLLHTRALDPSEEGCAVDMSYFDTGSQSVLAYATIFGSIVGWDLRSPGTAWKLESNPRLGLVTSFCVDPHHCWLVLGTATGNMICWDLRFQLPITTVSHPTGARIRHLLLHPREQSGVFAAVQGHNEVSLWDMETQARVTTLWACTSPPLSQTQASDATVYSMYVCSGENGSYLLTGGSDMKIRYWDLNCATDSFIVAGPANEASNTGVVTYRSRLVDGTEVIQELQGRPRTSNPSEDPPRRYPEVPHSGHHDCISGVAVIQTTQCFILSASRDGVVKVWK